MANGDSYDIKIPTGGSWKESKYLVFNTLIQQGRDILSVGKEVSEVKRMVRSLQLRLGIIVAIGGFIGMVLGQIVAQYVGDILVKGTHALMRLVF